MQKMALGTKYGAMMDAPTLACEYQMKLFVNTTHPEYVSDRIFSHPF